MNKFKHLDLLVYPLIFLSLWGVFALSDQYFVGAKFPFFLEDNEHGWFGIGLNWMSMHPVLWQHHPSPSFNQLSGLLVWLVNPDGTNKPIHQFITLVTLLQAVLVITAGFWFASVSSVIRLSHPQKLLLIVVVFLFPTLVYHTAHWSINYLIALFGLPVGLTIFGFLQDQKQLARTCGLGLGFLSANYYPSLMLLGLVILFARLGSSHNNTGYLKSAVRRAKQKRNISIIFLWFCLCAFLVGIYFSGVPILHSVDNFRPLNGVSLNFTFLVSTIIVGVLFAITGSLLVAKIVETRPDIGQFIFWTLIVFILSNGILLPWYLHGLEVIIQERATGIVQNVIRLIKAPSEYPWLLVPLFSVASFLLVIIVSLVSKESNLLKSKESLYGLIFAILGTGVIAIVATPELRPGTFPGKAERLFAAAVPALVVGWVILFKSLFGFWRYVWQIVLLVLVLYSFVHFYETYRIEIRSNRTQGQAIDKTIRAFFQDQHDGRVICVGDEFYSDFCTTAYAYNRYRTDASANALPMRRLFNSRVISLNARPDETGNWVDSDNLVDELVFDRFAPKLVITSLGHFQQHLIEMFFRRGYDIKPIWKWKHEGQNEKDRRILEDNFYGSFVAWSEISNGDIIDGNKYRADRTIPSHIDYSDQGLPHRDFARKDLSGANFSRANLIESDFSGAELQYALFVEAKISGGNFTGANLSHVIFYRADLSGANLSETDLTEVNLWGAVLDNTDLRGISISRAKLWGASLKNADLSNTNLSNQDFSGVNLEGANLHSANLEGSNVEDTSFKGSNLGQANLAGLDLSNKDLSGVNLEGVNLQGASLKGSNLGQANLAGLDLSNKDLSGVNLDGANLQGTSLKGSNLGQANLAGLDLSNKDLSGVNLDGANLQRANLSGSNLQGVNLNGSNLEGANLQGTSLKGSNLGQANLAGLDLSNKDLSGVNLDGANLQRAHLSGSNLQGTSLKGSNLGQANLAGLDLSNKDLSGVNLEGANLQGTSLKGSNLGQANLAGLDLSNKDLSGVNLDGANLQRANLSGSNLQGVNLVNANLKETNLKDVLQ